MEHGNDTVNKPRDSRKSIDKKSQDETPEKQMRYEKQELILAIKKQIVWNGMTKATKEIVSQTEQKNRNDDPILLEYEEIYTKLIKNLKNLQNSENNILSQRKSLENSENLQQVIENYLNTIKPPFCYYYNVKIVKNILPDNWDDTVSNAFMSYIKNNPILSEKPLSKGDLQKIIDNYNKTQEKEKDEVKKKQNELKEIIDNFRKDRKNEKGEITSYYDSTYTESEDIETGMMQKFNESLKDALKDYPDLYEEFIKAVDERGDRIDSLNSLERYYRAFFTNHKINYYILEKLNTKNKEASEYFAKNTQILIEDGAKNGIINQLSGKFSSKFGSGMNGISKNFQNTTNNKDSASAPDEKDSQSHYGEVPDLSDELYIRTMEELLEIEEGYLRSDEYVNEIILSSEDKERIEQALCEIKSINSDNLEEIRQSILKVFEVKNINIDNPKIKSEIEEKIGADIRAFGIISGKSYIMMYALVCGITDINNDIDLNEFVKTVQSDDGNGNVSGKYAKQYKKFLSDIGQYYEECITRIVTAKIAIQSLTARYEAAATVAEGRNFYESDIIDFTVPITEDQPQSGLQVASNIDNVDDKLNHYGFKSNKTEHEEAALKYTAFDITFKNTFNLTNPIIEKLGAQQVNLRDDLFKYGIYNQDSNTFNQSARDKYVAEKLEPIGLVPEEIEELGNAMAGLPAEVEKNYEILSGNFDTDQDNFEKIAKIYALGEIIDNIKNLFKNGEVFSDNAKLGTVMGFELDENEPADIVGDCLMLKGKVNGTETKIKYDLRTGKLYMNAMTQQEFNPPKITIGNDEPNTEIGDLGNFDDLLEGYQPTSFVQTDKVDYSKSSNENATIDENGDIINSDSSNKEGNDAENKDSNQKTLEKLMENKLLEKLAIIGNTVREKAGEQSKENNVIDEFLRTFNILPDEGNSNTIEFLGGSNLYIILESIKNTNDEDYLLKFSKLMSELMSFCGLTRGKNNLSPKDPDFDSVTIFNINEKNATQDIISLQRANQSFFSDTDGENDRIKGCECHFDSSVKLSFANIIVQKCCRRYGEGWKISANHAQEFVDSVKKGIEDIKHDENDVVAMENMIEDESMWA